MAFFDSHPINEYHTLVIPRNHYENIFDIPEEELARLAAVAKKLAILYREKLGIGNIQLINSSGREAGQSVLHFHFHIVPRRWGDGQRIGWTTHPEWVDRFDQLLERMK